MPTTVRIKLSFMMFLEFFIWGAWYVTAGTWLSAIGFSGSQIALVYSTTAIAAMISPFFVGMFADRLFATQRLLAVLHLVGGLTILLASRQTTFGPLYLIILIHTLCYMPTLALTNSLSFRQMQDPGREFPPVRVLGTFGWIVAGLIVGAMAVEATAVPLQLAGLASIALAIFSLTLPHTPPLRTGHRMTVRDVLGLDALALMKERSFAIFVLGSFLVCIPLQFYYAFANPFLNELGVTNAAGKMSMGQMSEVGFMLIMPWFFKRLGVKYMLLVGMAAWVARYVFFALGDNDALVWMLYLGILLHGICYDFFFVTGQIYVDSKANQNIRAAAQGFITFVTYGVGMFIGSLIAGPVVDSYVTSAAGAPVVHDWRSIWMVPAGMAFVVLILFMLFFRSNEEASAR
jgi:nucleoside transporter